MTTETTALVIYCAAMAGLAYLVFTAPLIEDMDDEVEEAKESEDHDHEVFYHEGKRVIVKERLTPLMGRQRVAIQELARPLNTKIVFLLELKTEEHYNKSIKELENIKTTFWKGRILEALKKESNQLKKLITR